MYVYLCTFKHLYNNNTNNTYVLFVKANNFIVCQNILLFNTAKYCETHGRCPQCLEKTKFITDFIEEYVGRILYMINILLIERFFLFCYKVIFYPLALFFLCIFIKIWNISTRKENFKEQFKTSLKKNYNY